MEDDPQRFVRDTIVAALAVAGLYALAYVVPAPPLQIPGYLVIVGFDAIEGIVGGAGAAYYPLFGAYVLGLGAIGAAAIRLVRRGSARTDLPVWRAGAAGAFAVVGGFSLLFALAVLVQTSQREPVVTTGAAGLVLLALAAWIGGAIGVVRPPAAENG